MTLSYNILWVDDTRDWVRPVKESIEEVLDEKGLVHSILYKSDGSNILSDIVNHGADLVILDHGLPGKNGDDLIRDIRNNGEITDIIFYSQDETNTRPFSEWEGVTSTHRDDAEDEIRKVIDDFVKRSNSISSMRGLIIAEAIDVENQLTEMIKSIFGDKSDILTNKILDKSWIDFGKKHSFLMSYLNDRIEDASSDKESLEACRACFKSFDREIIDQRNILAHSVKVMSSGGKTITLKGINNRTREIAFNNEWKNQIRNDIRKHRKNLQEISRLLGL